uniref:Uncharacterized protein n=1 Tax=Lepeophtheirus salmonis TaxID=72036 RepID=A0A0K2TT79_LEPSM
MSTVQFFSSEKKIILPPWLFRSLRRRLPLVSLVAFMDAVRMCCLAIWYDLYPRSSFTALENSCLLTPRFLANLNKEVPGEALMDFRRPSRKRGVRIRSLLMLWVLRQTFPATSQALKIRYTVVFG